MSCDFGPEPTVGQPQIEDDKVRLAMPCERDRVGDGAGDAAYLVTVLDKNLFREIRQHEVVFDNQDLEHAQSSSSFSPIEIRAATCGRKSSPTRLTTRVPVSQETPDHNI